MKKYLLLCAAFAVIFATLFLLPFAHAVDAAGNVQRGKDGKIIGNLVLPSGSTIDVTNATKTGFPSGGGTSIYGTTAPSGGIGADGDRYVNKLTGEEYKKVSGAWGSVQVAWDIAGAAAAAQSAAISTASTDATTKANAAQAAAISAIPSTVNSTSLNLAAADLRTAFGFALSKSALGGTSGAQSIQWGTKRTVIVSGTISVSFSGTERSGSKATLEASSASPWTLNFTASVRNGGATTTIATLPVPAGKQTFVWEADGSGNYTLTDTVPTAVAAANVTVAATPTNYSPASPDVEAHLAAINTALAGGGGGTVSDAVYDATGWDGDTTHAPSKNAVRDKIESLAAGALFTTEMGVMWPTADLGSIPAGWLQTGSNGIPSFTAIGSYSLIVKSGGNVSAPTFSPVAGTYGSTQSVTLSTTTPSAAIRYTTNGTDPTRSSGTVYSGAISVSTTTTVKAIAYRDYWADTAVQSATYTISAGAPTADILQWKANNGSGATITGDVGPGATNFNGTWTLISGSNYKINIAKGSSQFASTSSTVNYASNNIITVSFWHSQSSYTNAGAEDEHWLESSADWSNGTNRWAIMNSKDSNYTKILIGLTDNGFNSVFYSIARPSNTTLHHFAFVINNSTGGITAYIDGSSVSVTTEAGTWASAGAFATQTLYVGSRNNSSRFGDGAFDDFRIYAGALNGTQISAINAAGSQ